MSEPSSPLEGNKVRAFLAIKRGYSKRLPLSLCYWHSVMLHCYQVVQHTLAYTVRHCVLLCGTHLVTLHSLLVVTQCNQYTLMLRCWLNVTVQHGGTL